MTAVDASILARLHVDDPAGALEWAKKGARRRMMEGPSVRPIPALRPFANRDQDLTTTTGHLFPIQLGQELVKLQREPKVLVMPS